MFRALVEVQALATLRKDLPARRDEAAFVGTAIDLNEGDLTFVCAANDDLLLKHIRSTGRRDSSRSATPASILRLSKLVDQDAFPGTVSDRISCAVGAAMAQKTIAPGRVVMVFVRRDDLTATHWRRILPLMSQRGFPLILTLLPGATALDVEGLAAKVNGLPELRVPVIPVDAGDVVALYRVAQETTVRARSSGGASIIEAVACGTAPVTLLRKQLLHRGACTTRWLDRAERDTERLLVAS